jgi:hypothetical protein
MKVCSFAGPHRERDVDQPPWVGTFFAWAVFGLGFSDVGELQSTVFRRLFAVSMLLRSPPWAQRRARWFLGTRWRATVAGRLFSVGGGFPRANRLK